MFAATAITLVLSTGMHPERLAQVKVGAYAYIRIVCTTKQGQSCTHTHIVSFSWVIDDTLTLIN